RCCSTRRSAARAEDLVLEYKEPYSRRSGHHDKQSQYQNPLTALPGRPLFNHYRPVLMICRLLGRRLKWSLSTIRTRWNHDHIRPSRIGWRLATRWITKTVFRRRSLTRRIIQVRLRSGLLRGSIGPGWIRLRLGSWRGGPGGILKGSLLRHGAGNIRIGCGFRRLLGRPPRVGLVSWRVGRRTGRAPRRRRPDVVDHLSATVAKPGGRAARIASGKGPAAQGTYGTCNTRAHGRTCSECLKLPESLKENRQPSQLV